MNTLLQDRRILILGLGLSGLAMARWCARHGAQVSVADTREAPPQLEELRAEIPGAHFIAGPLDAGLIGEEGFHAIYRSPGLAPSELAALTAAARESGLIVEGELTLFAQALEHLKAERAYEPSVLAITGTNGKTTVTSLTGQLVERAGKSVVVAGNIGPSLLDMLGQALDQDALPEVWVLELSSFQLDAVAHFEPTASTVLNLTQDHLDWHGDMATYAAAKAKIFGANGVMIINRDDPLVAALRPPVPTGKAARLPQRPVLTFGAGLPLAPEDFGIEVVNGMAWLVRALEADETLRRRKDAAEEIHLQRLMPVDALRIRGRHNAVNALAALALAVSCGCQLAPMLYGLREYRGEPHRVESIGLLGDVEYFDDSKGTNVGATVAALNGLGADRKLVVILGGDGKGQDFSPLADPVGHFVRAVVLIGRDAALIRSALEGTGVPLMDAADMEQAVALAREHAQAGDAVLLSPACASLDMYRNYGHRADAFCTAVREIAHAEGVEMEVPA
ncbi:UDP-N-acetylmuramoyl-L-alanine--D-glutamate ligase [Ottowia thiooxydans]|uniref:UDP-N-acetylmuramoyl-L-alanine--D-glutamate ligase n=1 Tax=Ottowia thiooxydans TaxID=219182 RepID=UPI00040D060C|nr:UDP-N-acetylmuramoyl-L-alanine--D-glutamate ligase [Ottowia thiooxydans]